MCSGPNLVTIGDKPYYTTITKSVEQFNKIYPDGSIWIYDWGFTREQRDKLRTFNSISIISWEFKNNIKQNFLKMLEKSGELLPFDFELLDRAHNRVAQEQKEWILCQKPHVFYDCINRIREEPLIFLDGDAILNNKLPVLGSNEFDVGVTLRPHEEIEAAKERGDYHVLNSGVIIWNCSPEKAQAFVELWINRMQRCNLPLQEQSSLSKLIEEQNPGIYSKFGNIGVVDTDEYSINVKILDCREYNYNWIEDGWNEENRILHFKSGRFEDIGEYMNHI
jgi:hypothetical protein